MSQLHYIYLIPTSYAVLLCWTITRRFEKQLLAEVWSQMVQIVWRECLHGRLSSCNHQNIPALPKINLCDYFDMYPFGTTNVFIFMVDELLTHHLLSMDKGWLQHCLRFEASFYSA